MFWRLKIPARQYSLLFSPQVSARQVCRAQCVCPALQEPHSFNVFFAPWWISSCLKENTYTLLKVVSLLWVVETVNMIIINHRTIEKVTLGPSAWNWTGLSPNKVLFSLPHPGKSTCFHPSWCHLLPLACCLPQHPDCLTLTSKAFRQPLTPATPTPPSPSTLVQPLLLPHLLHSLLQ